MIEDNKKKWEFFQKHHWVSPEFSFSPVVESWERCIKQCSPYNWSKPHVASGSTLSSLIKRNQLVINCAAAVIEDTFDLLKSEPVMLLITDDNGCVLSKIGDAGLMDEMNELGIRTGCFLSEGKIGTNAVSLCINTNMPFEVFAAEHFNRHLHKYATCSAPIFDIFGRLRGTISLLKRAKEYTKENLAIAVCCAKEVSLQLHIQSEQDTFNRLSSTHNAILECMDDGILAWNEDNRITMINHQAELLLDIKSAKVVEKNVFSILRFPPNILSTIETSTFIRRKQTTIEVNGEFIEAIITLRPLNDGTNLLFIHPIDKIRELAQKQIGESARFTFDTLPVISRKMKHLITVAKRAIKSKAPILLTGETGVGKVDMAMAIHNESDFRSGPFISLNCRNINTLQMVRLTLGFDEGQGLPSKFELAHNGTLYLEKIEYLSTELQAMILKLLKTGLINRGDSQRLIPVKFQLIASTASNISEYVTRRSFSRQLYYEISANELNIPPLRERKEDTEYMIQRIINNYEKRHNVAIAIEKNVMDVLVNFKWTGNSSELKNRMERILLNRNANLIKLEDIPDEIKSTLNLDIYSENPPILSLEELEKKAIVQAWELCGGKMQEMAKALKIGRTTLWRKINKFGLFDDTHLYK